MSTAGSSRKRTNPDPVDRLIKKVKVENDAKLSNASNNGGSTTEASKSEEKMLNGMNTIPSLPGLEPATISQTEESSDDEDDNVPLRQINKPNNGTNAKPSKPNPKPSDARSKEEKLVPTATKPASNNSSTSNNDKKDNKDSIKRRHKKRMIVSDDEDEDDDDDEEEKPISKIRPSIGGSLSRSPRGSKSKSPETNGMEVGQEEESKENGDMDYDDEDEDDDEDSDDDVPLRTMAKGRGQVKKKQKRGRIESDEDDFEESDDDDDEDFVASTPRSRSRRSSARKRGRKKSSASTSTSRHKKHKESDMCGGSEVFPVSKYEERETMPLTSSGPPNRWWKDLKEGSYKKQKRKWNTLEHNAVVFPPAYQPHGIKMLYDGNPVELTPEQEEIATFFGVMLETDHAKKPVFQKNFFEGFKKTLGKGHIIKSFGKCDFSPIHRWAMDQKEKAKEERKKNRAKIKEEKQKLMDIYGFALVDGFREKVGNFRVEPPGLFRGRGEHPRTGMIKKRVIPEQITLNIGTGVKIPKCPLPGHKWKGVIHNPNVTWLAYWIDNINGDYKYVWLASSSKFKGISDFLKYEKSRALKKIIGSIRADYGKKLNAVRKDKGEERKTRELATATWMIDVLALRVGNEKDTDKEADTVGCCSLRTEHLKFIDDERKIHFHFLGKDSMVYDQVVKIDNEDVYRNLKFFHNNPKKAANGKKSIFRIDPSELNEHLRGYMEGLSAKVFRTYNASITLQREFQRLDDQVEESTSVPEKEVYYNRCNRTVAELCNHQRSIPKKHAEQMEKLKNKLQDYEDKLEAMEDHISELEGSKKKKKAKKKKKKSKDKDKEYKFSKNLDVLEGQKSKLKQTIDRALSRIQLKDENKQVALGTSKINYMDPRITVAWCKRKNVIL
ncbi:hypothetical protein AAMO2058_000316300 [Amorphochlora amoebiformis]